MNKYKQARKARRIAKSGQVVEYYTRKGYKKARNQKPIRRLEEGIRRIFDRHPDWEVLGVPVQLRGWVIFDDGMLLKEIAETGESEWTMDDGEAQVFATRREADRFIEEHWEEIGGGVAVNR